MASYERVTSGQNRTRTLVVLPGVKEIIELEEIYKTSLMRTIEDRFGEKIESLLQRMYHQEKKTAQEIADIFRVREGTVYAWFVRFNISPRTASEVRKLVGAVALKGIAEQVKKRRSNAFGKDIRMRLLSMHYEENLTVEEMSESTGYSIPRINKLMAQNGFSYITPSPGWIQQHMRLGELLGDVWANPSVMKRLSRDECTVLRKRHIDGSETLEEIGEELNPPRNKQGVSRIETGAVDKIRAELVKMHTS